MHTRLKELSMVAVEASASLLDQYTPNALYAFRVAVRRIRSILKHIDSHQSRRLRKIWGGFAAVSNDARDWDVFLKTAAILLSAEEFQEFERLNRIPVRHAHESVIEMLQSMHWARHLQEWDDILERSTEGVAEDSGDQVSLEQSLARAGVALDRALLLNDDHCWHKLRIRIKEIRYLAETAVNDDASGQAAVVVQSCKQLQTLLGDWHDTVVQLNLLEELPAHPVHATLAGLISERKQVFLAQARKILESHPLFEDL